MGRRDLEEEVIEARKVAKEHLDRINDRWGGMTLAQIQFHTLIFDANMRYAEFAQAELDRTPIVKPFNLDPPEYQN